MPVPWAASRARIPEVQHRGITVQQLRDLQVYLQRLCKAGILLNTQGKRIQWFDMNMYDISELVIKPAITHLETVRGTSERYSWVEFVATSSEQKPSLMFSHSWAGRFRDFMAVVDAMARGRGLRCTDVIWVCTFANSQFGENFGSGLRESPFCKAIQLAEETTLVVDREASSLQRIWCGLELHLTMQMKKPLKVYTSAGQVGVAVTSGRLVEAVEEWDVTRMEASQDSDRRQILNFLGGGEEHENDGLVKDQTSKLVLLDGWRKQLEPGSDSLVQDDEEAAPSPKRRSGVAEMVHEAKLFRLFGSQYEKLSAAVRANVLSAAKASGQEARGRAPVRVPSFVDRGITLGELRTFAKQVHRKVAAEEGDEYYGLLTVDQAMCYLPSITGNTAMSYVEWLGVGPRHPTIVINEANDGSFADLISAVDWYAEAQNLPEHAVMFFTLLCYNRIDVDTEPVAWNDGIQELLMNCEAFLAILPYKEEHIIRAFRLQQLHICFQNNKDVYLGCRDGVVACTRPFLDRSWIFGTFDPDTARIIFYADWSQARNKDEGWRRRLVKQVAQSRGGLEAFSSRLARVVAGPILRDAVWTEDKASLQELDAVARSRGFLPNSAVLQGTLGETAVHVAAAAGNLKALTKLLESNADPNAQDHLRETPLHYAALRGRAGAVRLLLGARAQPLAESAFAETPLDVAEQNPAAFALGAAATAEATALLRGKCHGTKAAPRPVRPRPRPSEEKNSAWTTCFWRPAPRVQDSGGLSP